MSDIVVDSSVVVKWVLDEPDSDQADRVQAEVVNRGHRLVLVDLAIVEVCNAIWKRFFRGLLSADEARDALQELRASPVHLEAGEPLLHPAMEIAMRYRRAFYDALFVALVQQLNLPGVTADEPLVRAVQPDFPQIKLLRDW